MENLMDGIKERKKKKNILTRIYGSIHTLANISVILA